MDNAEYQTLLCEKAKSMMPNMSEIEIKEAIDNAICDIALYLGRESVPYNIGISIIPKYIQKLQMLTAANNVKSQSYTEGSISESKTFTSPEETQNQIDCLLHKIDRYREVKVHGNNTK